jgi:hypothetical protein
MSPPFCSSRHGGIEGVVKTQIEAEPQFQAMRRKKKKSDKPKRKLAAKSMPRERATAVALVAELFLARRKMRAQVAKDRTRRYSEFLHEVEEPAEAPTFATALRSLAVMPGKRNLRILAEGDSWFEYPLPPGRGDGVIYQLEKFLGYPIANMAHHGLEVEQMLGLSMRQEIIRRLTDSRVNFDALLFSGGGNDIAGDQFCIWLKDAPPAEPPAQMLNTKAVSAVLAILEAEFRELVDLRDQFSPDTVIFVHAYDFPPVTGKKACGVVGPWLKPSLDYAYKHLGVPIPDPNDEFVVVKTLLEMFGNMLNGIAADSNVKKFVVVPTQGTLSPNQADWQNEIHPSPVGFAKIAQKFQTALASVFP